jgi:hypothetical protein
VRLAQHSRVQFGFQKGPTLLRALQEITVSDQETMRVVAEVVDKFSGPAQGDAEERSRVVEGRHEGGAKAEGELDPIIARAVASKSPGVFPCRRGINLGHTAGNGLITGFQRS